MPVFWAHFWRFAPKTGLSAPIFFAAHGAKKYFRFYPLRLAAGNVHSRFSDIPSNSIMNQQQKPRCRIISSPRRRRGIIGYTWNIRL
jgi:hypothetical protein